MPRRRQASKRPAPAPETAASPAPASKPPVPAEPPSPPPPGPEPPPVAPDAPEIPSAAPPEPEIAAAPPAPAAEIAPPSPAKPDAPEPVEPPVPRVSALLAGDARRGLGAAVIGAGALAAWEYVVSLAVAQGSPSLGAVVRFLALDLTLVALFLVLAAPITAAAFTLPRLLLAARGGGRAARYAGPGAGETAIAGARPAAGWLWAVAFGCAAYLAASIALTLTFERRFKEPQLIAMSLAALQLALIAVLGSMTYLGAAGLRRAGARLVRLGAWNPFGRVLPALGALVLLATPAVLLLMRQFPALRDVMPWRLLLSAIVYAAGVSLGARRIARRGRLWPRDRRRRRIALAGAAVVVALVPPTLVVWGAHPQAKYLAMTASPALSRLVDGVRFANDFDRDGYGSLLGENDCAPFDPKINPGAREIPDNGIDENCNGRDLSLKGMPSYRTGERMPVPAELRRNWNVLLITIDALRYDHTGFGGYLKARGRDTTPQLDKLVARSTSFRFAQSASAGTMASVPAIVASKFFHSGIALGPERRPMPPKILPQNVLLAEVMKRGGYHTGAILTHEYFNDWGLEQGFDTFDNSLGAKPNPYGITSQDVTSKAEAWIASQGDKKWFLWAHYLDPHGRYVAHPGEVQFGSSEEDLYDGEIAYTDKHIGKLLDFLAHSPAGGRTIIVVTSDHGDGFMEHGFINHAVAVYRELVHVPLIFYVPDLPARRVDGPVSNMDIYPTLADLAGIDISDVSIEGESLVPQLVYGRDARDRVVFAETNLPEPIRAAISDRYKLIEHLRANVYELYDLKADPWEKKNVWGRDQVGGQKMKAVLDEWLDRVYYARDPNSQAQQVRQAAYLLSAPPAPQHPLVATVAGTVQVVGWDVGPGPYVAGKDLLLTVYLTVVKPTETVYRLEAEMAQAAAGAPPQVLARQEKLPAGDGLFPTSRWRPREYVKETFKLRVPAGAKGSAALGLRFLDPRRQPAPLDSGATQVVLGEVVVGQ